jgi:uncharacterized protein YbcI
MQPKDNPLQTRGQLERSLSQSIQALYRSKLGHQPSKVTCRLLDQKIVIILEDSITQPEQVLVGGAKEDLAEQVRDAIDAAIEPSLKMLIAEQTGIEVIDLLSDSTIETGRAGMIAVLAGEPQVKP